MSTLKLRSNDGRIFEADIKVMRHSTLIRDMLENVPDDNNDEPILLPNCHSVILRKVLEYCTYHKDDPLIGTNQEPNFDISDDICSWDKHFLEVDQTMLFELIFAANYLDVKNLMVLITKHIANQIKGKTPDQIRSTFHIQSDFTYEELRGFHTENDWLPKMPQ